MKTGDSSSLAGQKNAYHSRPPLMTTKNKIKPAQLNQSSSILTNFDFFSGAATTMNMNDYSGNNARNTLATATRPNILK